MKLKLLLFSILFLCTILLHAQYEGRYWINGGHNQVLKSNINFSMLHKYTHDNFSLHAGAEFAFLHPQNTILNVWGIGANHKFSIKDFQLNAFVDFTHRPFSELLREFTYSFGIQHPAKHWNLSLGNFSRIYSLSKKGKELFPGEESNSLIEWRNLLYDIEYLLFDRTKAWNISLGISNKSDFLYNQATNFMLYSKYKKQFSESNSIFAEFRYQGAGSNNLQADYFGFIIKGGFLWTLN